MKIPSLAGHDTPQPQQACLTRFQSSTQAQLSNTQITLPESIQSFTQGANQKNVKNASFLVVCGTFFDFF